MSSSAEALPIKPRPTIRDEINDAFPASKVVYTIDITGRDAINLACEVLNAVKSSGATLEAFAMEIRDEIDVEVQLAGITAREMDRITTHLQSLTNIEGVRLIRTVVQFPSNIL